MNELALKYGEVLQINAAADSLTTRSVLPGQVVVVTNARGKKIVCTSGRLWVTRENDTSDYVLDANASLNLPRRGKLVISALNFGTFRLD